VFCNQNKNISRMNNIIGIRHEDKYVMERRIPLTPKHVKYLIKNQNLEVLVESSPKRIFKDEEFEKAGAIITNDLKRAPVIFGVKEIPESYFEKGKTYIFFSHVIKGQEYNMPMLKKMMEKKCNLIDYEKIMDEQGRRLIFFGKYAGLAGMINSLWSLGLRLKHFGFETPFIKIKQSHLYDSLEEAKNDISKVGFEIAEKGLPKELTPLTIGFTGYGNVSIGAQEITNLLPVKEISPSELLDLKNRSDLPDNVIYKIIFKEEDLSEPLDNNMEFDLQDYYDHPKKYKDQFEKYINHITVLMNCMYWDERYPRIITKDFLEKIYKEGNPKLTVIGDITCDPDGSIECTHKGTEIEDPVFVYNPFTGKPNMGHEGEGIMIMSVDILPSELPRESSIYFGDTFVKYVKAIAIADYNVSLELLNLPNPVKKALILYQGKLTPDYEYIAEYL